MESKKEPYVFVNQLFRFDPKEIVNQMSTYIKHGNIHILRVPSGQLAKITIGTTPYLLESRKEPYVFNDPLFKFDKDAFVDQTETYIHHNTIHIIRVPAGKIVKAWVGSTPYLLESREDPYIINDPLFKVYKESSGGYMYDSTCNWIQIY